MTEYYLYHEGSKSYIHLGKRVDSGFQLSAERIVQFVSERSYNDGQQFVIHIDSHDLPQDTDDSWVNVDDIYR